jgi:hypothetical protein
MVDFNFVEANTPDFDSRTYIQILLAIAKADKDNGPPEYAFVRSQARQLGIDYDHYFKVTDKDYLLTPHKVSRMTALVILKDAIALASLDGNFSLPEKQRIYGYAEKLDATHKDVDELVSLVSMYSRLLDDWRKLVRRR